MGAQLGLKDVAKGVRGEGGRLVLGLGVFPAGLSKMKTMHELREPVVGVRAIRLSPPGIRRVPWGGPPGPEKRLLIQGLHSNLNHSHFLKNAA